MNPSSSSNPALDLIAELEQSIDGLPANEQAEQIRRVAENNPEYRSEILEHFEFVFREMRLSAGVLGHIPVASQFREGDQLDSFRIKRFIDRGGMGEVYEAEDVALGRPVALKVIKPNSNSTTAEKRFQREGIVLAKLHHTHIVPIHRVGEVGGVRYCAMQYVRGATLQTVITQLSSQTLTTLGVNESSSIREMVEALLKSQSPQYGTDSTVSMHPAMPPTLTPKHRYGVFNPRSVYFESVARVVIQVADALQHSHQHGFCHRDIKPSNLMIDASGNCWVIDFGLAGIAAPDAGVSKFASAIAEPALTYGQLGTPEYMPPEQFGGKAGPPADIWSLGATMYELLTLQRPFACENRRRPDQLKRDARPIPPRRLVTSVPRDLQAICMKALATRPEDRYRSAQLMADDLRRWLGWQQTTVRPGWLTLRPVRLWAWRHKALAVAVFLAFFLLIGATAWSAQKAEQRRRELAYTKVHEEVNTLRNRGYGLLNWPEVVNKKLDMMQELLPDADLRDYRAATMVGLDARFVLRHDVPQDAGQHRGFSDVAFSRNGKRIATGGTRDAIQQPGEYTPGMLWAENRAYPPTEAKEIGSGPVVFAADDTPLQLLTPTAERKSVLVWNLAKNERLMEIPAAGMIQTIGVSPNAKAIAVSYQENGKAATVLWIIDPANPKSGTKEIPVATRSATAFAFSLDGKHVAVGTQGGEVAVYSTTDGKKELELPGLRLPIKSLAFGRTFTASGSDRPRLSPGGIPSLQLAIGTSSGLLQIHDLETRTLVNVVRDFSHFLNALAFSPDGTTLAVAGHIAPTLVDVATGRVTFVFNKAERQSMMRGFYTGVAYSPEGNRIAFSSFNAYGGENAGLDVLELDQSRGIRTYRGLSGWVTRTWISPSKKWVAALSMPWQLAVWDRANGQLQFVWDIPPGGDVGNSDLAFDAKDETIFFSSGKMVSRYSLKTGVCQDAWKLPFGLNDSLIVKPDGAVLLHRREQVSPKRVAFLLRQLNDGGKLQELQQAEVPTGVIHSANVYAGGKYLAVYTGTTSDSRKILLYDLPGGKLSPTQPRIDIKCISGCYITEDGGHLCVFGNNGDPGSGRTNIYRFPDMELVKTQPDTGRTLLMTDNAAKLTCPSQSEPDYPLGMALFRIGEQEPIVTFDLGQASSTSSPNALTGDGRYLHWGRRDGVVLIADVNQCMESLSKHLPK